MGFRIRKASPKRFNGGRKPQSTLTIYNIKGKPILKKQLLLYMKYCIETRRMAKRTIEYKTWIFSKFMREVPIKSMEELTNQHLNNWIASMTGEGVSAVTVNHCITQMIAMCRWFKEMNYDFPIQIPMIQKQPEPDKQGRSFYHRAEVAKVLMFADRREWLMIALFFDCGLRIDELRNLRLRHIEDRNVSILGKGSKLRYVMMSQETRDRLDLWIESEHITDYIFPSTYFDGNIDQVPMTSNQIRRNTKKVFVQAGYPEFHPHMLRHSFAMDLYLVQKLPVREIQYLLGHSKLETTEEYLAALSKSEQVDIWTEKRFSDNYTLDFNALLENAQSDGATKKDIELLKPLLRKKLT